MLRFITILLALATMTRAAETRLSVEGAAAYAEQHHPGLAAARLRIDEARGRLRQAGRLANPELELELSRNTRAPEGSWGLAFTQKFPLTSRLRLEKSVSAAELEAAQAEVRNEERKLAGQVRELAVKVIALRQQRVLREKQISHSKDLANFTTKRVEAGEASALDAGQVQLETQQLEAELLQVDVTRATLIGELRPLLGLKAGTALDITGELSAPGRLPASGANPGSRADFLAAQAQIRAAEQGVELARAQKWEDVGVGFGVEHERSEDAPEGFERDTFLGLKFSLPLPLWNKNEGRIDEAQAAATRARKEADALAATIRGEAAAARGEMAALASIIAKFDELIPAATRLEEQFRTSYGTGQVALPEVLRARVKRLELEQQRTDALRDYHVARVRHQTATATTPAPSPRKKLK
jgi:cobalt-zinc-cadmium efflux system outer membrane protein